MQIAQRWILMRLRKVTFFSLEDLNEAIAEQLEILNGLRFANSTAAAARCSSFEQKRSSSLWRGRRPSVRWR